MPNSSREPMAPSTLFSRSPEVSRRTLIGAAWSAPVVLAAVAAPLAAASGDGPPNASFLWSEPFVLLGGTSELQLVLPADSAGIGSTGTITFSSADGGSVPRRVTNQAGWVYDSTDNVGILISPDSGVSAGPTVFSAEWRPSAEPGTITATWTNSLEQGSLSDTIMLQASPRPTVTWLTNPVEFDAPTTLQVVVPADSAGIGQRSWIFSGEYLQDAPSPAFPSGTQISVPDGWFESVLQDTTIPALETSALKAGTYDFVYTIGGGTTPVSPKVVLAIFNVNGLVEAPLSIVAP